MRAHASGRSSASVVSLLFGIVMSCAAAPRNVLHPAAPPRSAVPTETPAFSTQSVGYGGDCGLTFTTHRRQCTFVNALVHAHTHTHIHGLRLEFYASFSSSPFFFFIPVMNIFPMHTNS
uniref:Putative secreted peptide n=1 Tax=Anopheles braziliensis TaxID=58242 RepID=A0A2M3ZUV0_9DIPT